jgi:diketogulonate reductase-like aldo/keto reductase
MEQLLEEGRIKAAGVSNYTIDHLEDLTRRSDLVPAVNQVEFHPFIYEQQRAVLEYCRQQGILLEAYSPLNRLGRSLHPTIKEIAGRLEVSPQQVGLRWCIQHGALPLPRSANPTHIASNFDISDFQLSTEDMHALDSLSDGQRVTWDPAGMG